MLRFGRADTATLSLTPPVTLRLPSSPARAPQLPQACRRRLRFGDWPSAAAVAACCFCLRIPSSRPKPSRPSSSGGRPPTRDVRRSVRRLPAARPPQVGSSSIESEPGLWLSPQALSDRVRLVDVLATGAAIRPACPWPSCRELAAEAACSRLSSRRRAWPARLAPLPPGSVAVALEPTLRRFLSTDLSSACAFERSPLTLRLRAPVVGCTLV